MALMAHTRSLATPHHRRVNPDLLSPYCFSLPHTLSREHALLLNTCRRAEDAQFIGTHSYQWCMGLFFFSSCAINSVAFRFQTLYLPAYRVASRPPEGSFVGSTRACMTAANFRGHSSHSECQPLLRRAANATRPSSYFPGDARLPVPLHPVRAGRGTLFFMGLGQ